MFGARQAWRIEQNDRVLDFAGGPGITVFAESGASAVSRHSHPAWKVVLPDRGTGLLVPPRFDHACAASSAFAAVFLDPWCVRYGPGAAGPVPLEPSTVRRVRDALGEQLDLDALQDALTALPWCAGGEVDPRVAHAVRACAGHDDLGDVAREVSLSPSRLRTLVREEVGIPLGTLRRWQRLRTAVAALPYAAPAQAAALAGFADQAHLTRTARRLTGRTPASLRPDPQSPQKGPRRPTSAK
ncbi:helix-turn-helix domain-containing protein [Streptomyces sp. NPDC054841]